MSREKQIEEMVDDLKKAYDEGFADGKKQSEWISVEERLPTEQK